MELNEGSYLKKGNISTNVGLKIKNPVKTTFTTSGSVSFEGEQ